MTNKLVGYDFYKSIGSPRFVIAPMVDMSELAWRLLGRRYGAQLTFTPMIHAANFVKDISYRKNAIEECAYDRPVIYQFCSNDPKIFTEAGIIAQEYCDAIDLNLGCPQGIAKRGHYGSYLQNEWDLIKEMLTKCVNELKVPVTAKIRAQSSIELTVKYAKMIESCGVSIITIHGRKREQKGVDTGLADWNVIKAVKEALIIPVFANGNIQYYDDVIRCLEETGADGVMSAEGHLHNPAIFTKGVTKLVWDMALEYLEIVKEHPCPLSYSRGHMFKLLHHALHYHTHIRDLISTANSIDDFINAAEELKKCCGHDNCKSDNVLLVNLPEDHWFCQPYIRPIKTATKRASSDEENVTYMSSTLSNEVKIHRAEAKRIKIEARRLCKENEKNKDSTRTRLNVSPCEGCPSNQRGLKCEFKLCKLCCKKKRLSEEVTCVGHTQWKPSHAKECCEILKASL